MSNIVNWADLAEKAAAEGFGPEELYDPGAYKGVVVNSNVSSSQGGKQQIGIRIQFEGGPYDGKAVWSNQTLSPENGKAMGAWFRTFEALGIPSTEWAAKSLSLQDAAARIVGARVNFTLAHRTWNDVKKNNVKVTGSATTATATPVPPVPQPPAAVPAPPAAAVPAPAPVAAPASAEDSPEVAALKAQLAAAQAAAPAAPAASEAPALPYRPF